MTMNGKGFSGRKALAICVVVLALLMAATLMLMIREEEGARLSFVAYERSAGSNYAVLLLTNVSARNFRYTTYNTSPEGTVRHFVSVQSGSAWSEPAENKPAANGVLYSFMHELEASEGRLVKVPVDEVVRKAAVPIFQATKEEGWIRRMIAPLRERVRLMLGDKQSSERLIWCREELSAPKPALGMHQ